MKLFSKIIGALVLAGFVLPGASSNLPAAEYPSKAITWVVPFPAGGGTDRWSRIMSAGAYDTWGVDWRVRNVPGASGVKGWKYLLDRRADGHTILMASPTPILALARETKPILDAAKDIKICALIGFFRPNIAIQKDAPYNDLKSLVAYAKKNPGKVVVGGSGSNTLGAAILFKQLGVKMTYVVYPGTGKTMADFLGGHIDIGVAPDEILLGLAPEKVTVIATSSNKPHPKGYEKAVGNKVPQPKDIGLERAFEGLRWVGVHPKTPDAVCQKISDNMKKLLKFKAVAKLLKKIGAQPIHTPMAQAQKEFKAMVESTIDAAGLLGKAKGK
ncbi:MAG: tripartite tricarboxylate transporter substrate binding protein [Proteobacteria bacterium]|nr:tripartite tricarboxylate transporter substrate binding protein [Pseudomonadota bacterium]